MWSLGLSWDLGWWYGFIHCAVLGKWGTLVKEWALLAKPLVSYGQSKHWSKIYKHLTDIWAPIGPNWVHWADCGMESDFGLFGPQIGAQLGPQIPAAGSQGFGRVFPIVQTLNGPLVPRLRVCGLEWALPVPIWDLAGPISMPTCTVLWFKHLCGTAAALARVPGMHNAHA